MVSMSTLKINAERLRADFEALSQIGATAGHGVSRLALSNEDLEARAWFASRIDEAGLSVHDDDAGNLSGILFSRAEHARTLLIGSHLDTVPNGGKYDGAIGILAGLECLRTIHESGVSLPVHLEVINFTDDEGCWHSLFGSRGLSGKLAPFAPVVDKESDNSAFRAALFRAGIRPADVHKAARDTESIVAYLELHVEQGNRLHKNGVDVGIVTGIIGRSTFKITFHGETGHSGTTSMEDRRDALQGAAAFITEAHKRVREGRPEGVFNCGNIVVEPGIFNLIPASACLTVECRHPEEKELREMEAIVMQLANDYAQMHRLTVTTQRIAHMPAAVMSDWVMGAIEDACREMGVHQPMHMISYAGHDAQMLSDFTSCGMIFIPSVNGISHNPREFTEWEHVVLGANLLLQSILNVAYCCAEKKVEASNSGD